MQSIHPGNKILVHKNGLKEMLPPNWWEQVTAILDET